MTKIEKRRFPNGMRYRIMNERGVWYSERSMDNKLPNGEHVIYEDDKPYAVWVQDTLGHSFDPLCIYRARTPGEKSNPMGVAKLINETTPQQVSRETKELFV